MSSLSSQAVAEESSEEPSSDGKQSAQSSGSPTPLLYLHSAKMMEVLPRFQSLITSSRLMETRGEDLLTWYREVFLARTSAAPVKVQASAVRVLDFGVRWRALFTKYNHDLHLWKTRPSLWDEGYTSSLPTLPRWGLMRDGVLWERVTLTRLTSATASGSLPTPVKYDTGGRGEGDNYHGLGWQARYVGDVTGPAGNWPKGFKPSTALWPTPVKNEARAAAYTPETSFRHFSEGSHQVHLAQVVRDQRMFPTPTCTQPKMPTATLKARMVDKHKGSTSVPLVEVLQRDALEQQEGVTKPSKQAKEGLWPTPMTTGMRGGSGVPKDLDERLNLPTPTALNGLRSSSSSPHHPGACQAPGHIEYGELNPDWVEWIMNWPIGWTSLVPHESCDHLHWQELTAAQAESGRNTWWANDPSDDPDLCIPKTVKPAGKVDNDLRMARIAALGNGQVPSVVAAAWTFLLTLEPPKE